MMRRKTNTLTVRTPEGIAFPLLLAGPVTRSLAWLADIAVITAASQFIGKGLRLLGAINQDAATAAVIIAYFVLSVGYAIVLEYYWRGQTLGKRLLRLRVMDERGLHLTFSQVAIRNLLRVIDALPWLYLVGGLSCLFSRRAQRLGDIAANTVVVRIPRINQPDIDRLLEGKYNSFLAYPHLAARLRQRVSPAEAALALDAVMRRNDFEPAARIELFRDMAGHFRPLADFPKESTENFSDEQYIRNVLGVLFQSGGRLASANPKNQSTDNRSHF